MLTPVSPNPAGIIFFRRRSQLYAESPADGPPRYCTGERCNAYSNIPDIFPEVDFAASAMPAIPAASPDGRGAPICFRVLPSLEEVDIPYPKTVVEKHGTPTNTPVDMRVCTDVWVELAFEAFYDKIEVHPKLSEAPHLSSSIPRPRIDIIENQFALRPIIIPWPESTKRFYF